MVVPPDGWLSRLEWLDRAGSTNDVVMRWLRDGTPQVCVAIADEQTAGRGRNGRSWTAPAGAGLLASAGFTPTWLEPVEDWKLAAIVSLAMATAAESVARLAPGTIRLKWPNDLVAQSEPNGAVGKLAGVLGETEGLGTPEARAVIGIGINAAWAPSDFPRDLAASMTSLAGLSPGRRIDREVLADAFLGELGGLVEALREGRFPADAWRARQLTNGNLVRLEWPDGRAETVVAEDVDTSTGALLVRAPGDTGRPRSVVVGEIRHVRIGGVV
jgi:BirA family transcriptional regulator, biotin operon repressor / biotin---[acetyl-CoA-carboxylase] ligase